MNTEFLMASLITGYPDESFSECVATVLDGNPNLAIPASLKGKLKSTLADRSELDDLRSDYIDTFDRGRGSNSLYETEYGRARAMVKGGELADLGGFYKAFGLELGAEDHVHEMLDHVSVELEFYALLLLKQAHLEESQDLRGKAIVLDARRKFLVDHLGRFVGAIAERPGVKSNEFYSEVFGWCRNLILEECARLDVKPEPASWVSGQAENETLSCGSSCVK